MTGWQDAAGLVQFRDDIYGLDTPQGIVTSTIQPRRQKPKPAAVPAAGARPVAARPAAMPIPAARPILPTALAVQ
jgi:hypothetical protein